MSKKENKISRVKSLPYARQKTGYMCGPASLQMVMKFFGTNKSQKDILKSTGLSERKLKDAGMNNGALIKAGQKAGFYVYVNENSSLAEIKYFIDLGLPPIVNYREPSQNDGHFAVVAGFSLADRALILHDPWNGKNFSIAERSFVVRWKGKYQGHNKWLMVLNKQPFELGKQFFPRT